MSPRGPRRRPCPDGPDREIVVSYPDKHGPIGHMRFEVYMKKHALIA